MKKTGVYLDSGTYVFNCRCCGKHSEIEGFCGYDLCDDCFADWHSQKFIGRLGVAFEILGHPERKNLIPKQEYFDEERFEDWLLQARKKRGLT